MPREPPESQRKDHDGDLRSSSVFKAGILIFILAIIFVKGVASLNLPFILVPENVAGRALGNGIANAIVGTILLALTSTILAIPFGVGTAIYLRSTHPIIRLPGF